MQTIYIKNWDINYYWEWEEININLEDKNKLETWDYKYIWWGLVKQKSFYEKQIKSLENNLLILSSKITWLKQLIENKLNTEDDLILLENLSLQAKELAGQRKTLKNTLLTNI